MLPRCCLGPLLMKRGTLRWDTADLTLFWFHAGVPKITTQRHNVPFSKWKQKPTGCNWAFVIVKRGYYWKAVLFVCLSSPSLVALEVDSEEDSAEPKSPLSPPSSDVEKSEDKREAAFRPSPDLTCTRSQSASSAFEPSTKVKTRPHHLSDTLHSSSSWRSSSLCRTRPTRGSDCAPTPTPPPKSLCDLFDSPGKITLQTSHLVSQLPHRVMNAILTNAHSHD